MPDGGQLDYKEYAVTKVVFFERWPKKSQHSQIKTTLVNTYHNVLNQPKFFFYPVRHRLC